ncbi:MAG: FHA domain-containing protein [Planctomycetes bacterium]|nr:FHA domain-containing protein [Planctomycetota bacterium]
MSRHDDGPRAVIEAAGAGRFELRPGGSLRIGRHHENDIVVKDAVVSRFHATLRWEPGAERPMLYDNGSQNGTQVDGRDVIGRAEPLSPGARVVIGSCRLTVEVLGTSAAALIEDAPEAVALFTEQGPALRGSLEGGGLRQVLLRLEVEARSGTLEVDLGAAGSARLTLAAGQVMDARHGEARGLAALDAVYAALRGEYRFTRDMEPCDEPLNLRFSDYLRRKHGSYLGTTRWDRRGGQERGR